MDKQQLKSDFGDVKVYREGLYLCAKGNPQHVKTAVESAFDRVVQRGIFGIGWDQHGHKEQVSCNGDSASLRLRHCI